MVYHRFTALADRKKGLRNDEIIAPGARSGRGRDAKQQRGVNQLRLNLQYQNES